VVTTQLIDVEELASTHRSDSDGAVQSSRCSALRTPGLSTRGW